MGYGLFANCTNLANITFNNDSYIFGDGFINNTAYYNALPDGAVYVGKAFYNYKGTVPLEVLIKAGTLAICPSAFLFSDVKTVTLPNELLIIGDSAFYSSKLIGIALPEGLLEIGRNAFRYTSFTQIELPESLKIIDNQAFYESGITSIVIPSSVEKVSWNAFSYSKVVTAKVKCLASAVFSDAFKNCELKTLTFANAEYSKINSDYLPKTLEKIFVPANLLERYKAESDESIVNKIFAIEK